MGFRIAEVEDVFVVEWLHNPTSAVIERLRVAFAERAKTVGKPLHFFGVTKTELPDKEARKAFQEAMAEMNPRISSYSIILGGKGLSGAAIRALVTALMMASDTRNLVFYSSLDDAMAERHIPQALQREVIQILKKQGSDIK